MCGGQSSEGFLVDHHREQSLIEKEEEQLYTRKLELGKCSEAMTDTRGDCLV